ncbi:MAG: sulfatase-like hydrolase/transferase [bacterium]
MANTFLVLIRQWFFWMLFFITQRALFLLYYTKEIRLSGAGPEEVLKSFYHAFLLDVSMACYLLVLPFIFISFANLTRAKIWGRLNLAYSLLILTIALLISIGEVGIFREWNAKLSYKALVYLRNPGEVISSVRSTDLVFYILLVFLQLGLFGFVYLKFVHRKIQALGKNRPAVTVLFVLITPILLFIGIRGGIGEIPITTSQAYFSRYHILNVSAVNPVYNLAFSSLQYYRIDSRGEFLFMPDEEARRIVKQLYQTEKDTTIKILRMDRPNILILLLESWSGDLIESLGGKPGLTPRFHELEREGILFTNFYASGNRSQQALASIFSGFPAIPVTTLTDHPQKYSSVPSMVSMLKAEGYYTSFFFGGDLNYGNIRSYLVYNGFDRLISEDDFSADAAKGKLGFHDESLYQKMLVDMSGQPYPFFTAALTLSSHSPYDQPGERPIKDIDFARDYVNSAWYADKCLGEFMEEIKRMPWYDSTLILILSDHSHVSYNNYQWWSFDYRRIPLLVTGGALKREFRGTTRSQISANMDITSTLVNQLGLADSAFYWSKDLFNPYTKQFAYFELNDGFGWKNTSGSLAYNIRAPMVLSTDLEKQKVNEFRKYGEAYLQVLFGEFLDY